MPQFFIETLVCYIICFMAAIIVIVMNRNKRKKIETWRAEREKKKEREMQEIGNRIRNEMMREQVRNEMMRENTLNSKHTVKARGYIKIIHNTHEVSTAEYLEIEQQARERRIGRMKNKRGKKLTAEQKKAITKNSRLNPANWLCVENNSIFFTIKHRETGNVKTIAY